MKIIQILSGFAAAIFLVACGGGGGGNDNSESSAKTENKNVSHLSPAVRTIVAIKGAQAQADKNKIFSTNISWDILNNAVFQSTWHPGWVDPQGEVGFFTIDQISYQHKLAKCKQDFNYRKSDGDRLCYPQNVLTDGAGNIQADSLSGAASPTTFFNYRYGYYCGSDHGRTFDTHPDERQPPEPLDPVDACCYYHDATVWDLVNFNLEKNTDGMAMCVANAKASPVDLLSTPVFADMSDARAYWYRVTWLADADILPREVPAPGAF